MQYHIMQKKGFPIDTDLASELNLLDEYLIWEEQSDPEDFCVEFENRFGLTPESLHYFEYNAEGAIQNLEGFEWDRTYVVFDSDVDEQQEWERLDDILCEQDIFLEEGEWQEVN
tara:strand:- start:472 stop:813 length:342 start_codon:yes stop_codon:yes gene_type:complete